MKRKNNSLLVAFLLVAALFIAACSDKSDSRLHKYVQKVKERKPAPVEPIPTVQVYPKYSYPKDEERRSPFKAFANKKRVAVGGIAAPDQKRPKEALEAYPLDSLRMVGVLEEGNKVWALIETPEGVVLKVTRGGYMGQNYGRVTAVDKKEIELRETVLTGERWENRRASLILSGDS